MTESIRQIAARIRESREDCGLTAEAVAQKLGISYALYMQYESGAVDIPVSALYEMAKVFSVDLTELLTGISPRLHNFCLVRNGEGVETERYKGYKFQNLAYNFIGKKCEPLLVTIEPEENKKMSLVTHAGQEFNYGLTGKVRVILGDAQLELGPGDALYFDPAIPHGQVAVDGQPAQFLTVILHDCPDEAEGKK
jgi:transcriptional regulator with XRE-family HTH domain